MVVDNGATSKKEGWTTHNRSRSRISTHPKSNLIGKSKSGKVPREKSSNSAEEIPVQKRKIQIGISQKSWIDGWG